VIENDESPREILTHVPIHGPRCRQTFPAEHAYHDEWQILVTTPLQNFSGDDEDARTGMLGQILVDFPVVITDRHSRIAAAFITWLGTNVGATIIRQARLDRKVGGGAAHFLRWCIANRRYMFANDGFRTIDYLTSEDWNSPKVCTNATEVEVADLVAAWLDSRDGLAFVQRAEGRVLIYEKGLTPAEVSAIQLARTQ
jgi:hypothetical protein